MTVRLPTRIQYHGGHASVYSTVLSRIGTAQVDVYHYSDLFMMERHCWQKKVRLLGNRLGCELGRKQSSDHWSLVVGCWLISGLYHRSYYTRIGPNPEGPESHSWSISNSSLQVFHDKEPPPALHISQLPYPYSTLGSCNICIDVPDPYTVSQTITKHLLQQSRSVS